MQASVIICTHNPNVTILLQALEALKNQDLSAEVWELIIVDNASTTPLVEFIKIDWHPNAKIIIEKTLGLSHSRVTGVNAANSNLVVFVDDDNILNSSYLNKAVYYSQCYPRLGCFGGKSIPIFEAEPKHWFYNTGINLGCQDLGEKLVVSNYKAKNFTVEAYPNYAPIGTGMVIKKDAFKAYTLDIANNKARLELGRKGESLASGEDNDIILTIIKKGYEIGYFPDLVVRHLIPKKRVMLEYLQKMAYESNVTWIKVLELHGISDRKKISKYSLPIRMFKLYLTLKAWQNPLAYIKWRTACGVLKGQSLMKEK